MNMNRFYKTKKTICFFTLLNLMFLAPKLSFSAQESYQPRSLYDTVIEQGIFSINVQPVPPPSNLPPAGAYPIDVLIKQLSKKDGFVIYPDSKTAFKQERLNFLKKNRTTFLKWPKEAVKRLDNYVVEYKGSLEALNNLQIFAEIVKCHQNGGTPKQCALQAGKDALMRLAGGTVIAYLGLGSFATIGALAYADYQAVINTVECYNELTGLFEAWDLEEEQQRDRMALGAGVGSMESYLELMVSRYEQKQKPVGDLLIRFWECAEYQSKRLKSVTEEFTDAWEQIENNDYPKQLQGNCETGGNLDEKCSSLISSFTVLTGRSLPETELNTSSLANEYQDVLSKDFEKKCKERLDDINKKIETIMQKKVDTLHHDYKRLDSCITHAKLAYADYMGNLKEYLHDNKNLNLHYEQQLAERYGNGSDKYKEGVAVLDRITNQIKTYQPRGIKGNMEYILKRLDTIEQDFEWTKKRLVKLFNGIETHIEMINKVEKNFKTTAQSKSKELAAKFKACANERLSDQTASIADEKGTADFKKLDQMAQKVKILAKEASTACSEAGKLVSEVKTKAANIKTSLGEIENQVKKHGKVGGKINQTLLDISDAHTQVEELTVMLGDISVEMDSMAGNVCNKTKELKQVDTNKERDSLCDLIFSNEQRAKKLYQDAIDTYKKLKTRMEKAKGKYNAVENTKKALDRMTGVDDLKQSLGECEVKLGTASDRLGKARQKISEIPKIIQKAKVFAKKIKASLELIKTTKTGKKRIEEVDFIIEYIESAYDAVKGCPSKPETEKAKISKIVAGYNKQLSDLKAGLEKLYLIFGKPGENGGKLDGAREKIDLIDFLNEMAAKKYAPKISKASTDMDICFEIALSLKNKPVSYVLSDYRGQSIGAVAGTLRDMGISVGFLETEQATSPKYENIITGQIPGAGTEVKISDTHVILEHYGTMDVEETVPSDRCSHIQGSFAVVNQNTNTIECLCDPLVLNAAGNRCIDCELYRQGYMEAVVAKNFNRAQAIIGTAVNCLWSSQAQAELNTFKNSGNENKKSKRCRELEARINSMANQVPRVHMDQVNALYAQSREWGCSLTSDTFRALRSAVKRQQQTDDKRHEQRGEALRREDEMKKQKQQELVNIWQQMIDKMNRDNQPSRQPHVSNQPTKRRPQRPQPGNTVSQKSFVAYYIIHGKGFAADFGVQTESNFNKFKSKTSKSIIVLGRGRTQKEAEQQACSKFKKREKPRLGLSYMHNGWLLRGVGGRCK